jgi:hypothetical protein
LKEAIVEDEPDGGRKASLYIGLVLGGLMALVKCAEYSDNQATQRDVYATLDDCKQDWGTAEKCEPVADGSYAGAHYYGPGYVGTGAPGDRPKASPHALTASPVSRGGFGSLSGFHSSGG